MRLALIRQRYNPYGGAERFIELSIAALERKGVQTMLITREWRQQDGRPVLTVNPFYAGRVWRDASFSRAVCVALSRERFELVQSHERIAGCDLYRAGDGVHRVRTRERPGLPLREIWVFETAGCLVIYRGPSGESGAGGSTG